MPILEISSSASTERIASLFPFQLGLTPQDIDLMEPSRNPPVDIDGFRESMKEVGVEEIVDPTLEIFLEESRRIFADLVAAVSAGDADIVRTSSHSLKSSSSAVWAHDLAGLLQGLESAALAGDMVAISEIFRRTEPEYDAVVTHLVERGVAA